ncbi:MAG TPA: ribosome biogenesis GTP-binding protein YihA/YsxC [Terriglobales bacterium]|jgi:GTP-binding protein
MLFSVHFEKSAAAMSDLPAGSIPEVALLGRSNVGKSSLLNALAGQANLARVSRTPGRTRLLNLFLVNGGKLRLVDCPGYGYAQASRSLRQAWGAVTQQFCEERGQLRLALLLADASIGVQQIDLDAAEFLRRHDIPFQLVATKWDRLNASGRATHGRAMEAAFAAPPLPFSSKTGAGREELRRRLVQTSINGSVKRPESGCPPL